jgi:AcrR family transcriptional regulator
VSTDRRTRDRLIDATIDVLETRGEQAVRLREIAEAIGVTQPAIYHFFANRDRLIEAAQAERYRRDNDDILRRFVAVARTATNAEDFFRIVEDNLRAAYSPDRRERRIRRLNVVGSCQFRPEGQRLLAETQAELVAVLGGVFQRAQDRGWARNDLDPFAIASWLTGQINGRVFSELDPDHDPPEDWNRVSLTAVMAVLTPDGVPGDPSPPRR